MAGTSRIKLLVITPDRQLLDEAVEAVVIPAHDGELGILVDRAPLMCELGIGQLRYTKHGVAHRVYIDGGFAQVLENRVVVLTQRAVPQDAITREVVTTAEEEAAKISGHDAATREAQDRAQQRATVLKRMMSPVAR